MSAVSDNPNGQSRSDPVIRQLVLALRTRPPGALRERLQSLLDARLGNGDEGGPLVRRDR